MDIIQQEESEATERTSEEVEEMVGEMPISAGDPVVVAAVGSVLYSWYLFYMKGDKDKAMFVGLWAPTLLAAAGYLHQRETVRKFKQGISNFTALE